MNNDEGQNGYTKLILENYHWKQVVDGHLRKKERKTVSFSLIKTSIQLVCHLSSNVHWFKQRFLI